MHTILVVVCFFRSSYLPFPYGVHTYTHSTVVTPLLCYCPYLLNVVILFFVSYHVHSSCCLHRGSCRRRLLVEVDSSTSSLKVSLKVSCCCLCRPPPQSAHPASFFYLFFTQRKKQLHITIRTVPLFT